MSCTKYEVLCPRIAFSARSGLLGTKGSDCINGGGRKQRTIAECRRKPRRINGSSRRQTLAFTKGTHRLKRDTRAARKRTLRTSRNVQVEWATSTRRPLFAVGLTDRVSVLLKFSVKVRWSSTSATLRAPTHIAPLRARLSGTARSVIARLQSHLLWCTRASVRHHRGVAASGELPPLPIQEAPHICRSVVLEALSSNSVEFSVSRRRTFRLEDKRPAATIAMWSAMNDIKRRDSTVQLRHVRGDWPRLN